MGQCVQQPHSSSVRYNFCLLFAAEEPLLLSTHTDGERQEIATAIEAAKAGTLQPSPALTRTGVLRCELAAGAPVVTSYTTLCGSRLALFSKGSKGAHPRAGVDAVLKLTGLADALGGGDGGDRRFGVAHVAGRATLVAESVEDAAGWVHAISNAACPAVCATHVDALLAGLKEEAAGGESGSGAACAPGAAAPASSATHGASAAACVARELKGGMLEEAVLRSELGSVDDALDAVSVRQARRMAMIAKRGSGGGGGAGGGLGSLGGHAAASTGGRGDASGSPPSEERVRAQLVSERAVHAALIEAHAERRVKWARLVETVARLPLEAPPESALRARFPALEAKLRLGATFISAYIDAADDGAASATTLPPPVTAVARGERRGDGRPLVLMVDVLSSCLRLLIEGTEWRAVPLSQLPSLYPGYRAAHYRAASAAAPSAAAPSAAAPSAAAPDEANASLPPEECCFFVPGDKTMPNLALHTDTAAERALLLRAVGAVALQSPLMPAAPLLSGALMREASSFHWATSHAVLLPGHLLLLDAADAPYPSRVLPLRAAVVYYRSAESSLVFTLVCEHVTTSFATRDLPTRHRWIEALSHCVPVGVVQDDGSFGTPRRRPSVAEAHDAVAATLVSVRTLQRELPEAESALADAHAEADARVAIAIDQMNGKASGVTALASAARPAVVAARSGVATPQTPPPRSASAIRSVLPPASQAARTPPSAPLTQLETLREVNGALAVEVSDGEHDVRMLQRAVVLLSTSDWARGEWVWSARVSGARTLWDVWTRAYALQRQWQRAADERAAAAERAAAERAAALAAAPTRHRGVRNGGGGRTPHAKVNGGAAAESSCDGPSVWSAWTGSCHIGVDSTGKASAETRRQAAAMHDEDWFISFANRVFEM